MLGKSFDRRLLEEEKLVRRARVDINTFMEYVMVDSITHEPIRQAKIHREIQKFADEHEREGAVIIVPRRHGKTTQMIGRVLFKLGNDPNRRIKIVSANDDIARKRITEIREHITSNTRLHRVFPNLREDEVVKDWSKSSITVRRDIIDREPSVEAAGILTTGVGGGATDIIFDDVVSFKNSIYNPALIPVVKQAFDEVWLNLLDPSVGGWVYICTPWIDSDLTADLRKGTRCKVLERPVGENFEPVWPEKWPRERLIRQYEKIGSVAFNRNFRLQPLSEEDRMFKESWVERAKDFSLSANDKRFDEMPKYVGVDLALGTSEKSSYTVIFVIAVDRNERRYPIFILRKKMTSPEIASAILDTMERFQPELLLVESNFMQIHILQWLEVVAPKQYPIEPYLTGAQKADLNVGLPALALEFEKGMWTLPMGDFPHPTDCDCPYCTFVTELITYPYSGHTDVLMACWLAREALRRMKKKNMVSGFEVWEVG